MKEIYLDNSATTPMCEEALAEFCRVAKEEWGNPSSLHTVGLRASRLLSESRKAVCDLLDGKDGTLVFTGSGSEANNLAIFGRAFSKARFRGGRIVTTAGEHASVSSPLARLKEEGFDVVEIPTKGGVLDREALDAALTDKVILVTMMLVNNETGAVYDLKTVEALMRARCPDAILHGDATQALGKIPFSAKAGHFDMLTVSAHKIEGPKGCGALWIHPSVIQNKGVVPTLLGGGQEGGLRPGTVNVPACASFAAAARVLAKEKTARMERLGALQSYLLSLLNDKRFAEVKVNLPPLHAPHILNITLPSIKSETLLHFMSEAGISVASGSACSSHGRHTSPPLLAFGLSPKEADCSIRISLSHRNEEGDLAAFADRLEEALSRLVRIR